MKCGSVGFLPNIQGDDIFSISGVINRQMQVNILHQMQVTIDGSM